MRLAFESVVTADLASFVGLPAAGSGGHPWKYCRAGLPYSLSSELKLNAERVSGYQYTTNLISVLDPRKKHGAERQPIPPLAYFERSLNGSERNPADRVALASVASLINGADGPVQLPAAIALYLEKRHAFLTMVKEHHYTSLKVPSYVSEKHYSLVGNVIRNELPVMAFPYHFPRAKITAGVWCYALLPDVPCVEDSEVTRQIRQWYKILAAELQPSAELKAQQLADLKAVAADGMSPMLQYLVVTLGCPGAGGGCSRRQSLRGLLIGQGGGNAGE